MSQKIIFLKKAYKTIVVISLMFFSSCDREYHNGLLESLIGLKNLNYKIICSADEFSTGGEGFYYCIYQLDDTTVKAFLKMQKSNFPTKPEYRKDWKVVKWRKTPVIDDDMNLFEHCYNYNASIDFLDCFSSIISKNKFKKEGNFYCAFYNDNKIEPYYTDFIILIPSEKRLYFVSQKI